MAITSKAQLLQAGYKGYSGWGETEALADFKATGGNGKYDPGVSSVSSSSSSAGASNPAGDSNQLFQQALALAQQQNNPTVNALSESKAALPQITANQKAGLETIQTSIQKRYDDLIASITGQHAVDEQSMKNAAAGEWGRRGLQPGGTDYEKYLANRLAPVEATYNTNVANVTGAETSSLMDLALKINNLPGEEWQKMADINLAIGQAQSGNTTAAVNILTGMGQSAQQAKQVADQMAQNATQFSQNFSLEQQKLAQDEKQFNAAQATTTNQTTAGERSIATYTTQLDADISSGATLEDVVSKYKGVLPRATILNEYNLKSRYGHYKETVAQLNSLFGSSSSSTSNDMPGI